MAEQDTKTSQQPQDQVGASKPRRQPRLNTPLTLLIFGLLLWILAAGAAVGANVLMTTAVDVSDPNERLAMTYLSYAPSTLLALLALVVLTVAAVRWGMFGLTAAGVPHRDSPAEMLDLLRNINQRLLLSEAAKRIAYRQQDLQALRRTINDDIDHGNFDAALVLVQDLAQTYGYREEAEAFRERINAARAAEQEAKITEALARLDEILARHDFDRAAREAAKIQRLHPESERVRNLMTRVREARERYKTQLEREFLEAAEREDITRAMAVLKTMDKYLTEAEAAPLRETARGVIGKQRDNLGVQFKIAVQDKEWVQAVRVGEQIIRDFPNTRMAEEVRAMIDLLRERAAGQQALQTR